MEEIFAEATALPVLTIERIEDAVPLARALVTGGLRWLEITFRTEVAPAAIRAITQAVPEAIVGAGTLLRSSDVTRAVEAGARFLVSPGLTPDLAAAGLASGLPFLPGVATPSEVMMARELGCSLLKFFPAASLGGAPALAALAPVFRGIAFCPTGGVTQENAREYLTLPNVPMVGGSWMAPKAAVTAGDWALITRLAGEASRLHSR